MTTLGLSHIGIRVSNLDRSLRFYAALGFERVAGPFADDPVVILRSNAGGAGGADGAGQEINLIVNAAATPTANVLMDVPEKVAGITHVAYWVADLENTIETLRAHGVEPRGAPVTFPNGVRAIFVRDPDLNVIELDEANNRGPRSLAST